MPELEVVELTSGIVPIPGPKGEKGDKGDTGDTGPAGATGATGPQGPKGDTGATGPQGAEGPRGVQGLTGPIGATGAAGAKGDKGDKGDTGAQGPAGATGAKGDKGDTGQGIASGGIGGQVLAKVDGPNYVTEWVDLPSYEPGMSALPFEGFDAAGEEAGLNVARVSFSDDFTVAFEAGDEGYIGTVALRDGAGSGGSGAAGEDGASAYEIAVQNGFVGTEAQWLASLVGPAGADGATGPKGDTGATGAASTVAGPQGPKGDTGAAGANGQGVPAGGLAGQVLVKVSDSDFDAEWVDFPFEVIQQMIDDAIAGNGGGGTDPEPEEPEEPIDPSGMTTVRWTADGITSPIPASRAGFPAGTILGDVAPQANGATLIMARDCIVDFGNGTLAFNMPETTDYLTNQTPSVLRMAYKGVIRPEANVIDLMDWGKGSIRVSVPWMEDRLNFSYYRSGDGNPEVGEDIGNINDFKLGQNHLYEVIWTNDAAGAGGHVRFYIDGVIVGSAMPTAYKVRASNSFWMNVNGSMGNTSNSRALEMEYMEIGFKA